MSVLLLELLKKPAPDIPNEYVELLIKHVKQGAATFLSNDKEKGPFAMYLMGYDYMEIADQSGWPIETIILTSLKYKWFNKKRLLELHDEKEAAQFVLKETVNTMVAATVQVIERDMQKLMRGEINESKYIPKDIYSMEKFLNIVGQLNNFGYADKKQVQNINVNVANLQGQTKISADETQMPQISMEEYTKLSREERLQLLAKIPQR
jgi:hypothetical protein